MLVYPFKFLWHDMSSSEEIASKKFRETNALQIIERKHQTIFMNHNADLQIALHVVLISTEHFEITLFETKDTK